jgi:hypothetical protein
MPRLSRLEMLTRLQLVRRLEPIIDAAYKKAIKLEESEQLDDNPHGRPWHVSFHASSFPGNDPKACPRKALYRMMDFSTGRSINRKVMAAGAVGKGVELDIVEVCKRAGILISADSLNEIQTGFVDAEHWLTCSVDLVIEPYGWTKPLPVEIKSAYHVDIEKMRLGILGPRDGHVAQLKTQIAMARVAQKKGSLWEDKELITHGYVYYFSRDHPEITAEFRIDHDEAFFQAGLKQLAQWRAWFEEGVLPETKPGKRTSTRGHPMGWQWSKLPCKWCDFAPQCKADFREGTGLLEDSVAVKQTQKIRPGYDPEAKRERVFAEWR